MRNFFLTLVTIIAMGAQGVFAEARQIGHRSATNQPVLDISSFEILMAIKPSMESEGFRNVQVVSVELSDNPKVTDYFIGLVLKVSYEDGDKKNMSISTIVPAKYLSNENKYVLDFDKDIQTTNGGPNNTSCVAECCKGCATVRNEKGKFIGCGECFPVPDCTPVRCGPINLSGQGAERVLKALSGLFTGLIKLM